MIVKPIMGGEDLARVAKAAADDGHALYAPTHYMVERGEVIGATNIGPHVDWWMRADQGIRGSMVGIQILDSLQVGAGWPRYRMLCAADSPYYPHLERAGFVRIGEMHVFERSTE